MDQSTPHEGRDRRNLSLDQIFLVMKKILIIMQLVLVVWIHPQKSFEPSIEDLGEQLFEEEFQFLFNEQKEDKKLESPKQTIIPYFFGESGSPLNRLTGLFNFRGVREAENVFKTVFSPVFFYLQ